MFLFQGFYSLAWTPLLFLYPPEILNYSIRANGVAFSQLMLNGLALVIFFFSFVLSALPLTNGYTDLSLPLSCPLAYKILDGRCTW